MGSQKIHCGNRICNEWESNKTHHGIKLTILDHKKLWWKNKTDSMGKPIVRIEWELIMGIQEWKLLYSHTNPTELRIMHGI